MHYYPPESRITPLTVIRRERLLPVQGQVLVHPGETVGPADVVARCLVPGTMRVLDVSRELHLRRDRVSESIRKSPGDAVQANEVIAGPGGLLGRLRRACRSPVEGQVIEVRDGLVLIEEAGTPFELRAHLKGQITNVMPNRGVVISAAGALIQGVWGNGGEAEGVLKLLVDSPQKPLRNRTIDVSCHGAVVVGGRIMDEKTLEQAVEAQVRGMIIGSVSADLGPQLEVLPFPVLVTEGFGVMPMSDPVFALLHANVGREAMISADTKTRWGARRPEVLIPLRAEDETPAEEPGSRILQVGDRVRLLRAPHVGSVGTVRELPPLPQLVDSGARLPVALVDLAQEQSVAVPVVNLELIR
jgi:hypothetical protein